jgi:tetratricopeptide (TPR) repeat protein
MTPSSQPGQQRPQTDAEGQVAPKEPSSDPTAILRDIRDLIDKGEWKQGLAKLDAFNQVTPRTIENRPINAMAHLLKARALLSLGEIAKAWAEGDRAIALAKEALQPAIEAEAICVLANIHWKKGKFDQALSVLEKANEAAARSKDERVMGIVNLEKASVHMKTKDYDVAEREYRQAIVALEKVGELRQLARAYNNFAHVFFYQAQWQKAEEMFLKCKRISEKGGFRSIGAWASFNRAEALIELDRLDEAQKELEWALPVLEELGDVYGQTVANSVHGVIHARKGDFARAEAQLEKARQLAERLDLPVLKGRLAYEYGLLNKLRGDIQAASILFKEARDIYMRHGATSELVRIEKELKELH